MRSNKIYCLFETSVRDVDGQGVIAMCVCVFFFLQDSEWAFEVL